MIQSFFTKDPKWITAWDVFLEQADRGLYNQYSDWIKAYAVFGFDSTFYLLTDEGNVVGGCGIVVAKFAFFKFYVVPCGPVLAAGYEHRVDALITDLKKDATAKGCCYFQISLPVLKSDVTLYNYTLPTISEQSVYFSGNSGTKFKYVIPLYGKRLVPLEGKTHAEVFAKYSKNHQRNIIKAATFGLSFRFVSSSAEVQEAYQCFELNAKEKGYPLRSYESMKATLANYIAKDYARMAGCFYEDKLVGAVYAMKCGNRFIYINGGVLKEFQHMNVSHFMHDCMIKESIALNYKSYDISVGGSAGVIKFKEGFGSELHEFIDTKHWILNPFVFKIYLLFENKLKKYKTTIAKILLKVKK